MALEAGETRDREDTLKRAFKHFSRFKAGYVDLGQLRALVKLVAPTRDFDQAKGVLTWMDTSDDYLVSKEEFVQCMRVLTSLVEDDDFFSAMDRAITEAEGLAASVGAGPLPKSPEHVGLEADTFALSSANVEDGADATASLTQQESYQQEPYQHPAGCRSYLQGEVVPLLRQGLIELVRQVEAQRLTIASGKDWEEGQYLPRGWQPFNPYRWLADWLVANQPGYVEGTVNDLPSYGAYNRADKAGLLFNALDYAQQGSVSTEAVLDIASRLRVGPAAALAFLQEADIEEGQAVSRDSFISVILSMVAELAEYEVDAVVHQMLGNSLLQHSTTPEDKMRCLFLGLDSGVRAYSGHLPGDYVLTVCQVAGVHEDVAQDALQQLGKDVMSSLTLDEFTAIMLEVVHKQPVASSLDELVTLVLDKHHPRGAAPQNAIEEVEPEELVEYVRGLPTFSVVGQAGATEVLDSVSGTGKQLLLLDVRSSEEFEVSAIPDAVHFAARPDASSQYGWVCGDLTALQPHLAAAQGTPPYVITYCSTGVCSGPVAVQLSEQLGFPVRSLCGGIINYYNQGGSVRDPSGQVVQAVHPGASDNKAFITRPNKFKI